MQKTAMIFRNEEGSVIVAALVMLVLLTIIGISASNISITETLITTNNMHYQRTFYTAEAGLEHVKELLKVPFVEQNRSNLAVGAGADWSFALNASVTGVAATDSDGDGQGDYEGGAVWIDGQLDDITYRVVVWNNADGGGPTTDTDGLIFARSDATGPRGSRCSVEQLIEGDTTGQAISGYNAQEGAGSGKSYTSNDADAMTAADLATQQL